MGSNTRRIFTSAILVLTLALGGCAEWVEKIGETQDTRLLNPDGVQGVRKAPHFRTDKDSPTSDQATDLLRGNPANCTSGGAHVSEFYCRQAASQISWDDATKARTYLASGLTLSNELCDSWFNRLQITQVTLHQGSDTISAFGSVTAAILGFTRSPSQTIGLTASLFGVGKQVTDNLASNYIVAVDLTSVAAAVREYRALYAQDIENAAGTWNYYTARRVIMAYDNTCSALFVRKFVNARVSGSSAASTEPLFDAAISAFVGESAKYFDREVTASELIDLYAYLFLQNTPKPVSDSLFAGLAADLKTADGKIKFKDGTTAKDLSNALVRSNIDAILKSRAQTRVDAVRAQLTGNASAQAAASKAATDTATDATATSAKADAALSDVANSVAALDQQVQTKQKQLDDAISLIAQASAAQVQVQAQPAPAQAVAAPDPKALTTAQTLVQTLTPQVATLKGQLAAAQKLQQTAKTEAADKASRAQTARAAANSAQQVAQNAQAAVTQSTGTPTTTPEAQAATASAPLGRDNKPLDSPPPP